MDKEVTVNVDDFVVPFSVEGLNEAIAPVGRPLLLNVTLPVYPPIALKFVVYVAVIPAEIACEEGETLSSKSGPSMTMLQSAREPTWAVAFQKLRLAGDPVVAPERNA